jgi:hypothetical protein
MIFRLRNTACHFPPCQAASGFFMRLTEVQLHFRIDNFLVQLFQVLLLIQEGFTAWSVGVHP